MAGSLTLSESSQLQAIYRAMLAAVDADGAPQEDGKALLVCLSEPTHSTNSHSLAC